MRRKSLSEYRRLVLRDGRYPLDAFAFLHSALAIATHELHGPPVRNGPPRHVSAAQICEVLRELALAHYGMLAGPVLNHWNIYTTNDFGEMVYLLVRGGFLGKSRHDRIEEFDDVYSFDDAFGAYSIELGRTLKADARP